MRLRKLFVALAALMTLILSISASAKETDIETEKRLGHEASIQADKSLKFVNDEKQLARVNNIGEKLAAIAKTVVVPASYGNERLADFTYTFKIVDDDSVNAFSLPAGYIYVNKGLLDKVESDDELAGVLAHEISHVSHHHLLQLLRKQSQIDRNVFLLIAAAAIGKVPAADMQNIFYGAQLVEMAKLNAWTQVAEYDADNTAIEYMVKSGYNPVGLLTFMEKMAREETYDPTADRGVFNDHPTSRDRANQIILRLKQQGIPINRREVSAGMEASVRSVQVSDKEIAEVAIGNRVIFQPADAENSKSVIRATDIANDLNQQFLSNPQQRDVRLSPDGSGVFIRDSLVIEVRPADAELAKSTQQDVAAKAKLAIQQAIMAEQLKLMY